jgi:hypothetical protein
MGTSPPEPQRIPERGCSWCRLAVETEVDCGGLDGFLGVRSRLSWSSVRAVPWMITVASVRRPAASGLQLPATARSGGPPRRGCRR